MQQTPTISLIISTYNWPEALALVLDSVRRQRSLPEEVLIADDGSRQETAQLIANYQQDFPVPLRHIWHEDTGFRLSAIRNKAIAQANSSYIVNIDGDVILHPRFIEDHRKAARPGYFVSGSRVVLGATCSREIFTQGWKCTPLYWQKDIHNRKNCVHSRILSRLFSKVTQGLGSLRGCNMAFWRKDLLTVNGFDESFEGWGREDSDITLRLVNAGRKRLRLKFAALCYHLYHKENDRNQLGENDKLLMQAKKEGRVRALKGIDSHL